VTIFGKEVAEGVELSGAPVIKGKAQSEEIILPVLVRNISYESSPGVSHIYLLAERNSPLVPYSITTSYTGTSMLHIASAGYSALSPITTPLDEIELGEKETGHGLSVQYRLDAALPVMPPGAVEKFDLSLMFAKGVTSANTSFTLRIHTPSRSHNFPFRTEIDLEKPKPKQSPKSEGTGNQSPGKT
jgi:hypothetical protein